MLSTSAASACALHVSSAQAAQCPPELHWPRTRPEMQLSCDDDIP